MRDALTCLRFTPYRVRLVNKKKMSSVIEYIKRGTLLTLRIVAAKISKIYREVISLIADDVAINVE